MTTSITTLTGDARREVSTSPFINWLHRACGGFALLLYTLVLLEVSLLPLHVDWARVTGRTPLNWAGFWMPLTTTMDILANIALYVPLGGLSYLAARRIGHTAWVAGFGTVGAGFFISLFVELTQLVLPARVPSSADIVCNVIGTALGAVLAMALSPALRHAVDRLREEARTQPWWVAAKVLACVLIAVHLRPYDAMLDAKHVWRAMRAANASPFHEWRTLASSGAAVRRTGRDLTTAEVSRARWDYALDRAGDVAGYAVFAFAYACAVRRYGGRGRATTVAYAGAVAVFVAALVCAVRLLCVSRGLDTAHIVCGLLGGLLGGAAGAMAPRQGDDAGSAAEPDATIQSRSGAASAELSLSPPPVVVGVGVALLTGYLLLRGLAPFERSPVVAGLRDMNWVPFAGHLANRPNEAILDITTKCIGYVLFGTVFALWIARREHAEWGRRVRLLTLLGTALAILLEVAHFYLAARHCDVTSVLIAACGTAAGAVGARWVADVWEDNLRVRQAVRVVDDPLTSDLMDGPAYDKATAIRPPPSRSDASRMDQAESRPRT